MRQKLAAKRANLSVQEKEEAKMNEVSALCYPDSRGQLLTYRRKSA